MAVLPTLPAVAISVRVGGASEPPAQEYDCPNTEAAGGTASQVSGPEFGTCEKYIESKDDTEFSLIVETDRLFLKERGCLWFSISIDGIPMAGYLMIWKDQTAARIFGEVTGTKYIDKTTGKCVRAKLMFAPLMTTDDATSDQTAKDTKRFSKHGIIEVILLHALYKGTHPITRTSRGLPSSPSKVSEKALKGKSFAHGAMLSQVTPTSTDYSYKAEAIGRPLAIFKFRYRSRGGLYDEMVIPRPPSPTPPPKDHVDAMKIEILQRLARERLASIKSEGENGGRSGGRGLIKREIGEVVDLTEASSSSKRRRRDCPIVIDLTGD